jgi:hypothetical protein
MHKQPTDDDRHPLANGRAAAAGSPGGPASGSGIRPPDQDPAKALYVHLAGDGGIFVVWGRDGQQAWLTLAQLDLALQRLQAEGGLILYSRDAPEQEPPPWVTATFQRFIAYRLPIKLLAAPHPVAAAHARQGLTLLMRGAYQGKDELVADLVARGVPLDTCSPRGSTALMLAADRGHAAIVQLLLGGGADPNRQDAHGTTALMFAAWHGHERVVSLLLSGGADPTLRGDKGLSARDLAAQQGHARVCALLQAAC